MNNIIHFMARLSLLYSLLWSISIHAYAHSRDTDPNSTYPTPDRLFHIARSLNRNLVCYDANQTNGKLDTKEPIKVYWLNREMEPGKTNGLSFIQKKMAYGYKVVSIAEHTCTITLTAYPEKKLTICQGGRSLRLPCQDRQPAGYPTIFVCQGQPQQSAKCGIRGTTRHNNRYWRPCHGKGPQIKKKYGCYQLHRSLNFFATILQLKNVKTA